MLIKREELYETLRKFCPGKYSVGLHGIALNRVAHFNDIDETKVDTSLIAKQILENGLRVESARTINGTVAFFGRLDNPDDLEKTFKRLSTYLYGYDENYIIVATPVEFECEDGRSLYVGATNLDSAYKKFFSTKGNEITTILDNLILSDRHIVDSRFILGRFKVINDEDIELEINPKHMSQNGKKFTSEEYESYFNFSCYLSYPTYNMLTALERKDFKSLRDILTSLRQDASNSYFVIETIEQLLKEEDIREFSEGDSLLLEELKKENRRRIELNRKAREEKRLKLERMANYSIEEIKEFALNNHPVYFQDFPDSIRNNIELMRELTKTPSLDSFIIYYLGDDVRNDSDAMINIVNNCRSINFYEFFRNNFDYDEPQPNISDLGFEVIGLDVRQNPLFWEALNTRISIINNDQRNKYPYFDIQKETRLAKEAKVNGQKK